MTQINLAESDILTMICYNFDALLLRNNIIFSRALNTRAYKEVWGAGIKWE